LGLHSELVLEVASLHSELPANKPDVIDKVSRLAEDACHHKACRARMGERASTSASPRSDGRASVEHRSAALTPELIDVVTRISSHTDEQLS
jgi:hypothetical protein